MECLWFIDPLFGSLLTPTSYDFIKKRESRLLLFERLWSLSVCLSFLTLYDEITQSVLLPFFYSCSEFLCVCVD